MHKFGFQECVSASFTFIFILELFTVVTKFV